MTKEERDGIVKAPGRNVEVAVLSDIAYQLTRIAEALENLKLDHVFLQGQSPVDAIGKRVKFETTSAKGVIKEDKPFNKEER